MNRGKGLEAIEANRAIGKIRALAPDFKIEPYGTPPHDGHRGTCTHRGELLEVIALRPGPAPKDRISSFTAVAHRMWAKIEARERGTSAPPPPPPPPPDTKPGNGAPPDRGGGRP